MSNLSAIYGYYSSQWRKAGLPRNISDSVLEVTQNLNGTAGLNNLDGSIVPSNEIWVISNVSATDATNTTTRIRIAIHDGTNTSFIAESYGLVADHYLIAIGEFILFPAYFLRAIFTGVTLNDDLILRYSGYIIKIIE